jgi:hypothetical protein
MTRRSLLGGLLAFGLAALFLGAEARAADATGTWTWTITRQNGDKVDVTLKLKQDGDKLTGTYSGQGGQESEIKDGKILGSDVSFNVVREFGGETRTIKYTGKLDGDTIKGQSEIEINGEVRKREFEAKRSK